MQHGRHRLLQNRRRIAILLLFESYLYYSRYSFHQSVEAILQFPTVLLFPWWQQPHTDELETQRHDTFLFQYSEESRTPNPFPAWSEVAAGHRTVGIRYTRPDKGSSPSFKVTCRSFPVTYYIRILLMAMTISPSAWAVATLPTASSKAIKRILI